MRLEPPLIETVIDTLVFDRDGLLPAIAQSESGEVLMLAWMNAEAVRQTLETGDVTYFSRSRAKLWRKGESSGHTQSLRSFRYDCDADSVLMIVDQQGPACHTNRPNCYFHHVEPGGVRIASAPVQ